jgi:polyhydroxyalkanoate synthase subunit PhaE
MEEPKQGTTESEPMLEAWMKTSSEFWGTALKAWSAAIPTTDDASSRGNPGKNRAAESWETTLKSLKAASSVLGEPGALEGLMKGVNTVPELMVKMLKPAWEGVFHLQQEWMDRAARIGKSTAAYNFENLDQEVFRAFGEIYQREFQQFLKVPPVGLTREYQERLNEALDKFNLFQATVAEFLSVVYLPFEKSYKVLQERLTELAEEGKLPEKSRDYYRIWIKILEGHYMTLFKSPDYVRELAKTLDTMGEYWVARRKMLEDALKVLPVPTQQEMDELYKEIYVLKKRLRTLEKQNQADPSVNVED